MTEMTLEKPTFLKGLIDSWQLTLEHGKARDIIPYWILGSAALGGVAAYNMPALFWTQDKLDAAGGAIGGLLTFNGIVLALCWSAFGKIYEIVGAGAFCAHLRKHKLLNHFLMAVTWCHAAQILAIMCTAFALATLWLPFQPWFDRVALGAAIATSIYAVRQGFATSQIMQDLIWRKSSFDEKAQAPRVQAVGAS